MRLNHTAAATNPGSHYRVWPAPVIHSSRSIIPATRRSSSTGSTFDSFEKFVIVGTLGTHARRSNVAPLIHKNNYRLPICKSSSAATVFPPPSPRAPHPRGGGVWGCLPTSRWNVAVSGELFLWFNIFQSYLINLKRKALLRCNAHRIICWCWWLGNVEITHCAFYKYWLTAINILAVAAPGDIDLVCRLVAIDMLMMIGEISKRTVVVL